MKQTALLCVAFSCLGFGQNLGNCPVLPANNIWNTPVDQLPVSPASASYINRIGATAGVHADFGSGLWDGGPIGIPFIAVAATQTKYPASFTYATESDPGPYAIPLNAPIEGGSQSTGDRHAIAVDTGNCILYELYDAHPQTSSWKAGSGAIFDLRSNALRTATWTSADAAGLPIFPGLVRYDEVAAGEIKHALRFTVPRTYKGYVWPARHYASSITDATYPPMGARFRLRANFDITGFSPANQVILKALKKYGMMVADNGSAWFLSGAPDSHWNNDDLHALGAIKGSDFEVVDVSHLMLNPNSGEALQNGVSVTLSPSTASVAVNGQFQFTASVHNSTDPAVLWMVNGVTGGNSTTGWVSPTGLYTAPNVVPSPSRVTVQASSHAVPSATATASVTVLPSVTVTVSPTQAMVRTNRSLQFNAKVAGAQNQTVIWKVNGVTGGNTTVGTITTGGLYRAPATVPNPATVTVSATSAADGSAIANAAVTIRR